MRRHENPSRSQREGLQSRRELGQLAARMLVRGEARGFHQARVKAAESLGLSGTEAALEGLALLQAVIEYQNLFDRGELPERNRRLRLAALEAIKFLRGFSPRLHGPVLFGTTFSDSPVGLYLFADEVEDVTRYLLHNKIPFNLRTPTARRGRQAAWPVFECHRNGVDFELSVLPVERQRQMPSSRLTGRTTLSLDEDALAQRLADAPCDYWLEGLPLQPPRGLAEPGL